MIHWKADYDKRSDLIRRGAKWDFKTFSWCTEEFKDYFKFAEYLEGEIVTDTLYILEVNEVCPFCGAKVKLVALGVGEYTEHFLPERFGKGSINILYGLEYVPKPLLNYFLTRYHIKKRYSRPYGYEYHQNGCERCDEVFVDAYLFEDMESPFLVSSKSKASKIKVKKIVIGEDIALKGIVAWSVGYNLFDEKKIEHLKKSEVFE